MLPVEYSAALSADRPSGAGKHSLSVELTANCVKSGIYTSSIFNFKYIKEIYTSAGEYHFCTTGVWWNNRMLMFHRSMIEK